MKLPLEYKDIIKALPHRYPFLLVDRIIELEPLKRAVGLKNVTANEPFFQGHFPGNPIMPAVLIIEAMAQVGGILSRYSINVDPAKEGGDLIFFVSIDKAKFRKPVIPGDQLIMESLALRTGSRVWKIGGKAYVEQELVAEGQFVATIAE